MKKRLTRYLAVLSVVASLIVILAMPASAAIGQTHYVIGANGKITIPMCYLPEDRIEQISDGTYLSSPANMSIDRKDNLFVADSGNNRIVMFDADMKFVRQYTAGNTLNNPSGVFHNEKTKEIYIADTGNLRVVVLDEEDNVLRQYTKPESELLSEDLTFDPKNVTIGIQGYMYILKGQYFMQINQDGEFKGFVGSTKVGASLISLLIRRFASEKQKDQLVSEQPAPYENFTMDKNGVIYATTGSYGQIRKINMVGDNLFPVIYYGEQVQNTAGDLVDPRFSSIAVSDDGIVSALEANSKRIYQFSQTGQMLSVFGGDGEVEGFFTTPSSIAVDSKGSIYVADTTQNTIQRFTRSAFSEAVYEAQKAYDTGDYENAYDLFIEARTLDPNYPVVNEGLAKCLYKLDRIDEAAAAYKAADNRGGYGSMQHELRQDLLKEYFGWIVLGAVVIIVLAVWLIKILKKYADKMIIRYYHLDE